MELKRRQTEQRKKILDYVNSVRTHPTAEDVYNHVKKEVPSITLATVYRNLHILVEQGMMMKISVTGEFHFDADTEDHVHLVCEKCNEIIDYENDKVFSGIYKAMENSDFLSKKMNLQIEGLCKNCL